jgi:DNA helicase-4
MKREGRFKICINPACELWTPTCPKCGAEMVLREGRFGAFWGCRNYRKEALGCGHTENQIIFHEASASIPT